jgi:NAD(P)-dependent dehydrogenase (short-subunit alcohol dehydrogenase family)
MKIQGQSSRSESQYVGIARNKSLRIFEGASAIVTGGASGIGLALGKQLASRGCAVCLADRQLDLVVKAAAEIRASGGKATAAHVDVGNFSAVERVVREVRKRTGRLDYMFNNAGIGIGGAVSLHRIDDWNRIVDVNLIGVINGVQAAYKVMLQQGFGHIVNTASIAGLLPAPGAVAYAATKYAVVGLSRSLRVEASSDSIRVSALCPGAIRTPILQGGGKYGKSYANLSAEQERRIWDRLRPMSPDAFAERALDAVAKNRAIVIVPSWWKLFWYADRLFPSLTMALTGKSFRDLQEISEGKVQESATAVDTGGPEWLD